MGLVKDALLHLIEVIYPNDLNAQDELQGRLMGGEGLYPEEYAKAQSSDVGQQMISHHMIWGAWGAWEA